VHLVGLYYAVSRCTVHRMWNYT